MLFHSIGRVISDSTVVYIVQIFMSMQSNFCYSLPCMHSWFYYFYSIKAHSRVFVAFKGFDTFGAFVNCGVCCV